MTQEEKARLTSQNLPLHLYVEIEDYVEDKDMYTKHFCVEHPGREIEEVCNSCLGLLCSGCGSAKRNCCALGNFLTPGNDSFSCSYLTVFMNRCGVVVTPGSITTDMSGTASRVKTETEKTSKRLDDRSKHWFETELKNIDIDDAYLDKMERLMERVKEVADQQVCYTTVQAVLVCLQTGIG